MLILNVQGVERGRVSSCCIKGCIIPECTEKHNVNFCGECIEFPCDKVNTSIYKKTIIDKWLNGNHQIKEYGIRWYYEENKNIPHYIDYT